MVNTRDQKPIIFHQDTLRDIKKIVNKLETGNRVEDAYIGFGGAPSEQFALYEQLKELATEEQLMSLTNHANPAVRCYAFQALAAKQAKNLFPILLEHMNDTALVVTQSGCIVMNMQTCNYFMDVVTPNHVSDNLYKLNSTERHILDSVLLSNKAR